MIQKISFYLRVILFVNGGNSFSGNMQNVIKLDIQYIKYEFLNVSIPYGQTVKMQVYKV